MQFVHGKEPLHRFLDARQAVQAVLARKRFAGRTFGRPMMVLRDVWTRIRGPTGSHIPANGNWVQRGRRVVLGPTPLQEWVSTLTASCSNQNHNRYHWLTVEG
jgi:hypothetical protein